MIDLLIEFRALNLIKKFSSCTVKFIFATIIAINQQNKNKGKQMKLVTYSKDKSAKQCHDEHQR
jgi:hypothetical protein